MADFTASSEGAGAAIATGKYVNIAAAAVSVTLIAGVGVWGYKLLMRDVTGVPVVKAMVGEMRVAPENPGGEIASNIGLSVNSVPAEGGAAAPEDRLVLAPSGVALEAEDFDVTQTAEAGEVAPAAESDALAQPVPATLTNAEDVPVDRLGTPVAAPLTENDVLALADQIAAGAIPLSDLAEGETTQIEVAVNGVAVNSDIIPDAVPGVRRVLASGGSVCCFACANSSGRTRRCICGGTNTGSGSGTGKRRSHHSGSARGHKTGAAGRI